MAFSSELFEGADILTGAFGSVGTSTLNTNRLVAFTAGSRSFSTTVSGNITITFRADGHVNTRHVDAVWGPGAPGLPPVLITPAFDALTDNPDPRISVSTSATAPLLTIAKYPIARDLLDGGDSPPDIVNLLHLLDEGLLGRFRPDFILFNESLLQAYPLSGFPFYDALPTSLKAGIAGKLRAASNLPDKLAEEFGSRFSSECAGVRQELSRIAGALG
jgi:hypothetical protein